MSDFNNDQKCKYCHYPIIFDWLCDPDSSDRENPDYYHLGCWEQYRREYEQQSLQPKQGF